MSQYFSLVRDTQAPQSAVISVLSYYKDNTTPINISVQEAHYMKMWCDTKAVGTAEDAPADWSPYASTWTPNFTTEGTNYVHGIFMDEVGNQTGVVNSEGTLFDKTVPTITGVAINNDADIVGYPAGSTEVGITVKVTAGDGSGSGVGTVKFTGDYLITEGKTTEFTWSDDDRTAGFKTCTVYITPNPDGTERRVVTINAQVTDRAGNQSQLGSDNIIEYSGGVDPVVVLKNRADTTVLGQYNNVQELGIALQIAVGEPELVKGYKLYGDINKDGGAFGTVEPMDYTDWDASKTREFFNDWYFTSDEGTKTITMKSKVDESGTEVEKEVNVSVVYSNVQPTIVLNSNKSVISDKTSFDTATLTSAFTSTFDINEYKVVAYDTLEHANAGTYADATNVGLYGTTPITGATKEWQPSLTEAVLVTAIAGEGQKYLVAYGKNLCGNTGKSNVFTLSVDLTAPVGNIVVNQYYKQTSGLTASANDTSGVSKMVCWCDNTPANEVVPEGATEVNYQANPTAAQVYWTGITEGNGYAHIKYTDSVGNFSFAHSVAFIWDITPPTGCSVTLPAYTNTATISATLSASDTGSGMGQFKVYGDVSGASTAEEAAWQEYTTSANITLTNGDGTKTVNALFKDKAGNVIAAAVTGTTILDTASPAATLVLYNAANDKALGTKTNVVEFTARVGANEDLTNITHYKLWGDVVDAGTEEGAEWKAFTPDTGKTYMSVTGLSLTSGAGLKTVNVKVKDKAGNPSVAAIQTVTYDTSKPVITVSDVDYNIVSDKTTKRRTASGAEIDGTANNKMTFKFTSNTKLSAFKVCVNDTDQQASTATAIPMTGGSINMSGSIVEASTPVSCTLMETDFSATSKVASTDGTYEVIVYGQNEAGTWSDGHVIS